MKTIRFTILAMAALLFANVFAVGAAHSASVASDYAYQEMITGVVDADTDTFWCSLHTSSLSPSKTWQYRSSLTNEVSGTGYTAGGHVCTVTVSIDTTNHRIDINIASQTWTSSTISGAHFVCLHKHRGGASSADEWMGCFDAGADSSTTAGTLTVNALSPALRVQN